MTGMSPSGNSTNDEEGRDVAAVDGSGIRVTRTKTFTRVTFANPHLACDECGQPVPAMRSDTNANLPCGHLGVTSACPSWGPVDGCGCSPKHPLPQGHWRGR